MLLLGRGINLSEALEGLSTQQQIVCAYCLLSIIVLLVLLKLFCKWIREGFSKKQQLSHINQNLNRKQVWLKIWLRSVLIGVVLERKSVNCIFGFLPICIWLTAILYGEEDEKWTDNNQISFYFFGWNCVLLSMVEHSLIFFHINKKLVCASKQVSEQQAPKNQPSIMFIIILMISLVGIVCCFLNLSYIINSKPLSRVINLSALTQLIGIYLLINYLLIACFYGLVLGLIPTQIFNKEQQLLASWYYNCLYLKEQNSVQVRPLIEYSHQNLIIPHPHQISKNIFNHSVISQEDRSAQSKIKKSYLCTSPVKNSISSSVKQSRYSFNKNNISFKLEKKKQEEPQIQVTSFPNIQNLQTQKQSIQGSLWQQQQKSDYQRYGRNKKSEKKQKTHLIKVVAKNQHSCDSDAKSDKEEQYDSVLKIEGVQRNFFHYRSCELKQKRKTRRNSQIALIHEKTSKEQKSISKDFMDISNYKIEDLGKVKDENKNKKNPIKSSHKQVKSNSQKQNEMFLSSNKLNGRNQVRRNMKNEICQSIQLPCQEIEQNKFCILDLQKNN